MPLNFNRISLKAGDLLSKYYRYLLAVVIVIILIIGYTAVIKPKWDDVSKTGVFDYNQEKKNLAETSQYLEKLQKSIATYNQISRTEISKISQIIPSSEALPDLYVIFENIAKVSEAKLTSLSISSGKSIVELLSSASNSGQAAGASNVAAAAGLPNSQNIYVLDIALNLGGIKSYEGMKNLLDNMEKEIRIMDITSLSFNSDSFNQAGVDSGLNVNLRTYYYLNSK